MNDSLWKKRERINMSLEEEFFQVVSKLADQNVKAKSKRRVLTEMGEDKLGFVIHYILKTQKSPLGNKYKDLILETKKMVRSSSPNLRRLLSQNLGPLSVILQYWTCRLKEEEFMKVLQGPHCWLI